MNLTATLFAAEPGFLSCTTEHSRLRCRKAVLSGLFVQCVNRDDCTNLSGGVQGNCEEPYLDNAHEFDPPLPEWDPSLKQCLIILPDSRADSDSVAAPASFVFAGNERGTPISFAGACCHAQALPDTHRWSIKHVTSYFAWISPF